MNLASLARNPSTLLLALPAIAYAMAGLAFLIGSTRGRGEALARRVDAVRASASNAVDAAGIEARRNARVFRAGTGNAGEARAREFARLLPLAPEHAAAAFLAFRIVLTVLLVAALLFLGYRVSAAPTLSLLAVLGGTGLGIAWLVPLLVTEMLVQRRLRAVEKALPEAIELLIIAVEAGLALEDAVDRIVGELRHTRPLMAEQLALTSADLKILPDRELALAKLAERVDLPSVRSVVTTLSQTMRYGTPLAQALRVVAAELRNEALLRLEERANKMPVLLTIPMVVFILPSLFLLLGGPVVLKLMKTVFPH